MTESQIYFLFLFIPFIAYFIFGSIEEIHNSRIYRKARIKALRNYRINKEKEDKETFLNELRRK